MSKPTPFGDDAGSFDLGGLTAENGTVSIAIYGQTELTRDKAGLARARALLDFMQSAVHVLEGDATLPDKVAPPKRPGTVRNPFS